MHPSLLPSTFTYLLIYITCFYTKFTDSLLINTCCSEADYLSSADVPYLDEAVQSATDDPGVIKLQAGDGRLVAMQSQLALASW